MPQNLIPYWDFDAPAFPTSRVTPQQARMIASALYELSQYDRKNSERYKKNADRIVENLTNSYRTTLNKDNGFLLLHSTGTKPTNVEVDVPIAYADYYFIEALLRKDKLRKPANFSKNEKEMKRLDLYVMPYYKLRNPFRS